MLVFAYKSSRILPFGNILCRNSGFSRQCTSLYISSQILASSRISSKMYKSLEFKCFHGEMDITTVFGTVVPGSNPGGSTKNVSVASIFVAPTENDISHFRQDSNGKPVHKNSFNQLTLFVG